MGAIESFWALLGVPPKTARGKRRAPAHALPETESVRKIVDALEHLEPAEARYLAAFAYMLSRIASADRGTSAEETRVIEQILGDKGKLTVEQAALVAEIARHQTDLFGSTENFLVGREFDRLPPVNRKSDFSIACSPSRPPISPYPPSRTTRSARSAGKSSWTMRITSPCGWITERTWKCSRRCRVGNSPELTLRIGLIMAGNHPCSYPRPTN